MLESRVLLSMSARALKVIFGCLWMALATPASATVGTPPAGAILDLAQATNNGLTPSAYTQYSTSFVATSSNTTVSFIFRDDPAWLSFDNASVSLPDGVNLLSDSGFESSVSTSAVPSGWELIAQRSVEGALEAGTPTGNADAPYAGAYYWYDGVVGAYDGLAQSVPTVIGQTYDVSFYLAETGNGNVFGSQSSGGEGDGGGVIDTLVYAGNGTPSGFFSVVPEPSTWVLMLAGFGLLGFATRRGRSALGLVRTAELSRPV